ncbi:dihydrodipicolinate synthase family protein [Roseovarius sp. MBR-78]|uniref:dihydrodipicolinate synthase family protein n=1 Tax=Roseovarius sp. MBR-78 TaxID=3156460 RepID=UPI0033936689
MSNALAETRGLHVVVQMPFLDGGTLDLDSIDTLSALYYRYGAQGLTVLGVSGEAMKLTVDETIAVAARYVGQAEHAGHGRKGRRDDLPALGGAHRRGSAALFRGGLCPDR